MKVTKCGPLAPRVELFPSGAFPHRSARGASGPRGRTLALLILLLSLTVRAEDWPQFRGENSSGVSKSDKPLPTKFSLTENLLWSVKLGDGIGSPIVAEGKVFSTA